MRSWPSVNSARHSRVRTHWIASSASLCKMHWIVSRNDFPYQITFPGSICNLKASRTARSWILHFTLTLSTISRCVVRAFTKNPPLIGKAEVERETRALYNEVKIVRGVWLEKYSQIDVTIISACETNYDTGVFESVANDVFTCQIFETIPNKS